MARWHIKTGLWPRSLEQLGALSASPPLDPHCPRAAAPNTDSSPVTPQSSKEEADEAFTTFLLQAKNLASAATQNSPTEA